MTCRAQGVLRAYKSRQCNVPYYQRSQDGGEHWSVEKAPRHYSRRVIVLKLIKNTLPEYRPVSATPNDAYSPRCPGSSAALETEFFRSFQATEGGTCARRTAVTAFPNVK